jgi:hypothetical protein
MRKIPKPRISPSVMGGICRPAGVKRDVDGGGVGRVSGGVSLSAGERAVSAALVVASAR